MIYQIISQRILPPDPIVTLLASKLTAASAWTANITEDEMFQLSRQGNVSDALNTPYSLHGFFLLKFNVDAYWSNLHYTFSTGLEKVIMPRINSSVSCDIIADEEYPVECHKILNALFLSYPGSALGDELQYYFEACMPSNITQTPWKNQTTR